MYKRVKAFYRLKMFLDVADMPVNGFGVFKKSYRQGWVMKLKSVCD